MYILWYTLKNIAMNHYILTTILTIVSLTSILSNSIKLVSSNKVSRIKEETTVTEKISYTLREYNGKIALFTGENTKPDVIYDIFTASLPEVDSNALKQGITVQTEKEAQKIIEEYTS